MKVTKSKFDIRSFVLGGLLAILGVILFFTYFPLPFYFDAYSIDFTVKGNKTMSRERWNNFVLSADALAEKTKNGPKRDEYLFNAALAKESFRHGKIEAWTECMKEFIELEGWTECIKAFIEKKAIQPE